MSILKLTRDKAELDHLLQETDINAAPEIAAFIKAHSLPGSQIHKALKKGAYKDLLKRMIMISRDDLRYCLPFMLDAYSLHNSFIHRDDDHQEIHWMTRLSFVMKTLGFFTTHHYDLSDSELANNFIDTLLKDIEIPAETPMQPMDLSLAIQEMNIESVLYPGKNYMRSLNYLIEGLVDKFKLTKDGKQETLNRCICGHYQRGNKDTATLIIGLPVYDLHDPVTGLKAHMEKFRFDGFSEEEMDALSSMKSLHEVTLGDQGKDMEDFNSKADSFII